MNRLLIMTLLVSVCLLGCGEVDPRKGVLEPGIEAIVYEDPAHPDADGLLSSVHVPQGSGTGGTGSVDLPYETVVEVLEDAADPTDPKRLVRVRITEGEWKDLTAKIERERLRALPEKTR